MLDQSVTIKAEIGGLPGNEDPGQQAANATKTIQHHVTGLRSRSGANHRC